jgi:plastocyanin
MGLKRWVFVSALTAFLASAGAGYPQESDIIKDFSEALRAGDRAAMVAIIKENKDKIPAEIEGILEEAYEAPSQEKESLLYMVEVMASIYKDLFGDIEFFKWAKKNIFEAWLTKPVRSVPQGGVHIVDIPKATETVRDKFRPDNIIIGKGDTVRWVNSDNISHLLGSMPFIGEGGLSSPDIAPGKSWEYTFDEPGEYFYICFIHRAMIGKITVVELKEEARRVGR